MGDAMTATDERDIASDGGAPPIARPSAVLVSSYADGFTRVAARSARDSFTRAHIHVVMGVTGASRTPRDGTISALLADTGFFVDVLLAFDAPALLACRADVVSANPAAVFILVADDPVSLDTDAHRAVRQADLVVVSNTTRAAVAATALHAPLIELAGTESGGGTRRARSWLAVVGRALELRMRVVGDVAHHLRDVNDKGDPG